MGNISSTSRFRHDYRYTNQYGYNQPLLLGVGSFYREADNYRNGGSNPKWREVIADGGNATNAMHGTQHSFDTIAGGSFRIKDVWGDGSIQQEHTFEGIAAMPTFAGVSSVFTDANNMALKVAYRKIQDNRTSFMGGVFLGELRESLKMLTSPAKALRQGLSDYLTTAVRRGRASPRKARPKVVAETWLEYSFGWGPLVNDIHEAVKAYVKHVNKVFSTRIVSRGYSQASTFHIVNARGSTINFVPLVQDMLQVNSNSVQYIIGLKYSAKGANPDIGIIERAGLTVSQFVPTLWELMPWSFLYDYFANIGDIIAAGATDTSDVIWVCKTERATGVMLQSFRPDPTITQANRSVTGTPCYTKTTHKTVNRTSGGLGWPSFTVNLPSRPIQWMNMAALGVSLGKAHSSFRT